MWKKRCLFKSAFALQHYRVVFFSAGETFLFMSHMRVLSGLSFSVSFRMSWNRVIYVVKFLVVPEGTAGCCEQCDCIERFKTELHVENATDIAQGDQPGKRGEFLWNKIIKKRQESDFRGKLTDLLLSPDKGIAGALIFRCLLLMNIYTLTVNQIATSSWNSSIIKYKKTATLAGWWKKWRISASTARHVPQK